MAQDKPRKIFLCHSSTDSEFVCEVANYLEHHAPCYYYELHQVANEPYTTTIEREIKACTVFVAFVGRDYNRSEHQINEVETILGMVKNENPPSVITVDVGSYGHASKLPERYPKALREFPIVTGIEGGDGNPEPSTCAQRIVISLHWQWDAVDGLPIDPHLFSYEKDIIDFFVERRKQATHTENGSQPPTGKHRELIGHGCPARWPEVERYEASIANVIREDEIGQYRDANAKVSASALSGYQDPSYHLTLPEAGPREYLAYPRGAQLTVGIVVSGGIAPGVNAVIDGIVQRHWKYAGDFQQKYELEVIGFKNGFDSVAKPPPDRYALIPNARYSRFFENRRTLETSKHANDGGSIIGTCRLESLLNPRTRTQVLEDIYGQLIAHQVDILYVIGGDGSMKAAHAIFNFAKENQARHDRSLSIVTIPKTMDNDILWVWQSFGFLSAVEKAREVIDHLSTEVESNPRICVIQLFGSDSGFVVNHAVLASSAGQCDLALIPEVPFSMTRIAEYLQSRMLDLKRRIPYALIVMAETAVPTDAESYFDKVDLTSNQRNAITQFEKMRQEGKRIEGQTSDELRRAGLEIVQQMLRRLLGPQSGQSPPFGIQWEKLRIFSSEPRHLVRSIPPSTADIIMAHRLGTLAVDNAIAGYTDFMISQWLTEFVLVPLKLVVLGRKRIPRTGIFWRSVLAKTGQPADLN